MTARPISTSFNVYWSAWFTNEYDGAPDSHSLLGHGKTEAEAIAHLLEWDGERVKPIPANSYEANHV